MTGILIGLVLGLFIAILPAILIAFSKLVSGREKVIWVIFTLLAPYLLKLTASTLVIALQGNTLPYGLGPIIPLSWYTTAWAIYFVYKYIKGSAKDKIIAIIFMIVFLITLSASVAYFLKKNYEQQEGKTIIDCGSEKIYTKIEDTKKLYITANYIRTKPSFYIGDLEDNNIVITRGYNNIKSINTCLQFSGDFKLVHPEGSIHNIVYKWDTYIHKEEAILIFRSEASKCSSGKYDKREDYEYLKWRNKFSDKSLKKGEDSFLFDIDGTVKKVKPESIEFTNSYSRWCSFSTDQFKYIFTPSFVDSNKIILWKFSESGDFLKEIHITLPNNMRLEEGKEHHISHILKENKTIQFRIYKVSQGNKEQEWKNMCSYNEFQLDEM